MDIKNVKKGDLLKLKGSNIGVEVVAKSFDPRYEKAYVKIYNDVTDTTKTLIDISKYEKY
jgi:hypothetical protein